MPETNSGHISTIQYQAIHEAYVILSDPKRRDLYDQRLITERQRSYELAESSHASPFRKIVLFSLLIAVSGFAYVKYQNSQLAKQRELQRIELEKEQAKLQQEELRIAAENARLEREQEREQMYAAKQEARERERNIAQSNYESRRYAADLARAEDAERRRQEAEQRERARQEAEWQRRERQYGQNGPMVIRR